MLIKHAEINKKNCWLGNCVVEHNVHWKLSCGKKCTVLEETKWTTNKGRKFIPTALLNG
jgi:hypothetical protein